MALRPAPRAAVGAAPLAGAASSGEISYRSSQWLLALWMILPLNGALVAALPWFAPAPPRVRALVVGLPVLILLVLGRLPERR